jgi:hypothetical protein
MSTKLETLLASGELHRLAPQCSSQGQLATRLGLSKSAYINCVYRIRKAGRPFPSFAELAGIAGRRGDSCSSVEKIDAAIGEPFVRSRIEAIEAFDDGQKTEPRIKAMDAPGPDIGRPGNSRWPSVEAFDDPPLPAIPPGHRVHKVSTLVDGATGDTKQQWIKTTAIDDGRADWLEAIRVLGEGWAPVEPVEPVEPPAYRDDELLSVFPVGDPHIGMKAWHEDAGENFDLKIAERNLVGAFQHLIGLSPPSGRALLIFIGDNTHSDGQHNGTTNGTRVDVDGRTIKMMRVAVSVARQAIDLALGKHGHVTMIVERGNHDELLSAMLALALSLLYENEPRVTIDTSPEMFHWYRFGANLIGSHHGHKAKSMDLLGVMAVDRQRDWGETKHRIFYVGHEHHEKTKEVPGLIIHNLPTLASADAWHRAMGYRSCRAMYMDVIHVEYGHINRHIVGIQQITARSA